VKASGFCSGRGGLRRDGNKGPRNCDAHGARREYVLRESRNRAGKPTKNIFFSCPHCADEVSAAARFVEECDPLLRAEPQRPPSGIGRALKRPRDALARRPRIASIPSRSLQPRPPLPRDVVGYPTLILVPGLREQVNEIDALKVAPSYFLSASTRDAPVVAVEPGQRTSA